jgi:recombination protein RecA
VDCEIIVLTGSWFSYGDTQTGSRTDSVKSILQDNPDLMDELEIKKMESHRLGE